jgi:hypothetical protein
LWLQPRRLGNPAISREINFEPDKSLSVDYISTMSSTETINAIKGLSEEQRQRALQIKTQIDKMEAELQAILRETGNQQAVVDLPSRSIDETQAADLRARLKTFSEDWDRPEAAIYDQSPAR